jgi:hypothetical protein
MTEPVTSQGFTREEVWLALRNHGMHLEGLRYPITPIGMHYLLIHFDIPPSTRRHTSSRSAVSSAHP